VAVGHKRRVPVVWLLKAGEDQSNFAKPSLFDSVLFVQDQWFCVSPASRAGLLKPRGAAGARADEKTYLLYMVDFS
jgi:hypothetical protein